MRMKFHVLKWKNEKFFIILLNKKNHLSKNNKYLGGMK